jgi:hypothetical protein
VGHKAQWHGAPKAPMPKLLNEYGKFGGNA